MVRRRTPDGSPWPALLALGLFFAVGGGALWWVVRGIGVEDEGAPAATPPGLGAAATVSPLDDVVVRDGTWRLVFAAGGEERRDPAAAAALVARVRDGLAWVRGGGFDRLYPEAMDAPREIVVRFPRNPPTGLAEALQALDEGLRLEDAEGRPVGRHVVLGPVPRVAGPADARGLEHAEVVDLLTFDPDGATVTLTAYENRPPGDSQVRIEELAAKMVAYARFVERGDAAHAVGSEDEPPHVRIVVRYRFRPAEAELRALAGWRESLERGGIAFEVLLSGGNGPEEVLDLG